MKEIAAFGFIGATILTLATSKKKLIKSNPKSKDSVSRNVMILKNLENPVGEVKSMTIDKIYSLIESEGVLDAKDIFGTGVPADDKTIYYSVNVVTSKGKMIVIQAHSRSDMVKLVDDLQNNYF